MKKPRPFSHRPIYIDARQERLSLAEQHARQELGLEPLPSDSRRDLHGVFAAARRQRQGGGAWPSVPMMLSVVLILLAVIFLVVYSR